MPPRSPVAAPDVWLSSRGYAAYCARGTHHAPRRPSRTSAGSAPKSGRARPGTRGSAQHRRRWERGELEIRYAELVALAMDRLEGEAFGTTSGMHPGGRQPNNPPAELSTSVGREEELAELCRLMETGRLLTLTGTGGVGTTRVVIRLAREVRRDYPDGVGFVDLAPQSDLASLARTVAATLEACEDPTRSVTATLAATR